MKNGYFRIENSCIAVKGFDLSDIGYVNATEWDMKYYSFMGTLQFRTNPPNIIHSEQFDDDIYSQKVYCHFEKKFHQG